MAVPGTKGIIFDCFGVLYLDTKQSLLSVVPDSSRAELKDVFTANNYGYYDREQYLRRISDIAGLPLEQVSAYIATEHHKNAELLLFIEEKLKPEYKIGLLSNIGREWIDDFFSRHQLHEFFDEVVLSGEEGIAKPHPSIFELMASRLGLDPSECLMIDDIQENAEGAQIAGMQAITFRSNSQLLDELYERKTIS